MLIICPSCAASYRVETACFGEAGRLVRCVRCGDVWLGTESLLLPAASEQAEISAAAAQEGSEAQSLETPEAAADIEPLPDEPAAWEPITIAAEVENDNRDAHELPQQLPQFAAVEPPTPLFSGFDPEPSHGWLAPPAQIEAAPLRAYAVRRSKRAPVKGARRGPLHLLIAILVLVALHSALIGWRRAVVRIAPQTASLYRAIGLPVDLRGLAITNVTTITQLDEGVPLLLLEGTLASTSARRVTVPRLRFSVHNSTGQELYSWTEEPERRALAPGDSLTFRSRLASPPAEAHDVVVRFFNRDDTAGMQQTAAMRTARRKDPQ